MNKTTIKTVPLLILVSMVLLSYVPVLSADGPAVELLLFYSETCPHCQTVMEDVIPVIEEKYGDQVRIRTFNITDIDNYALMLGLERIYGVPDEKAGIPEIFLGNDVMIGANVIRDHLEEVIDKYLAKGGFQFPPLELIPRPGITLVPAPTATATPGATGESFPSPTAEATGQSFPTLTVEATKEPEATPVAMAEDKPIHLAYFHEVGCQECDRALYDLKFVQSRYERLIIDRFDIEEDAALSQWLGERYGVPEEERLDAPIAFVGGDYLRGAEINSHNVLNLVEKYRPIGTEAIWESFGEKERREAETSIMEKFGSLNLLLVLGGGLMDGLNPCAFATLVFFISYLAFMGRKGGEILAVGIAFALGVFLTYFCIGLGFLKFLGASPVMATLRPWFNLAMALFCLILAFFSFYDYLIARQGRPQEMSLRMPLRIRRWVNRVIREGASMRAYVLVAFVTGFIVSLLEFACTGQVYVPIISTLSVPALRRRAVSLLVVYNLAFVLPLVVVFLLAFFGTTSEQMGRFINKYIATIKLLTAALFIFLAGWLTYTVLPLFGLQFALGG